jgi:hypothetical protein
MMITIWIMLRTVHFLKASRGDSRRVAVLRVNTLRGGEEETLVPTRRPGPDVPTSRPDHPHSSHLTSIKIGVKSTREERGYPGTWILNKHSSRFGMGLTPTLLTNVEEWVRVCGCTF